MRVSLFLTVAALAFVSSAALAARDIGSGTLIEGPKKCGAKANCYEVEISCPEVREPMSATLRVRDRKKLRKEDRGTIYFATGGGGSTLYVDHFGGAAKKALKKLRKKGFRTVEVGWVGLWLDGAPGANEGQARLGCRPATLARWIYDNLHTGAEEAAFCATGNSGGASQVGYMISHYGLADILDAVVPTGGPVMSRMDLGCLDGDARSRNEPTLNYSLNAAEIIDRSWGFFRGDGPCVTKKASARESLRQASVAGLANKKYVFENTMVWLVFGERDGGGSVGQGMAFFDKLVEAGTPLLGLSIAPDTPHATPSTTQGANEIRDVLLEACVVRD